MEQIIYKIACGIIAISIGALAFLASYWLLGAIFDLVGLKYFVAKILGRLTLKWN